MAAMSEVRHLGRHEGEVVQVKGWVETTRGHGKVAFIVVRDGTGIVQSVLVRNQLDPEIWDRYEALTQESTVTITGRVRADARAPGGYELTLQDRSEEHTSELQSRGHLVCRL